MADMPEGVMADGQNLSNRDKVGQGQRGMDGKYNQTEQ
jgi:hypothetical protein